MRTNLLIAICLLAGCVAKGRYELTTVQLEATRAALDAREADSREKLDAAREAEAVLLTKNTELQAVLETQTGHLAEIEAELDRSAITIAEHVVRDRVECPPLPEPPPPPEDEPESPLPEPAPPDEPEPPEIQERRAHVEASLEDIADALDLRAHARLDTAERDARHSHVVEAFQDLIRDGLAVVTREEDHSVVRFLVVKLYNENRTTLSPLGLETISRIATALKKLPDHTLRIEGHTDDRITNSTAYPSNWELGFAYAVGVLRTLRDEGVTLEMAAASHAGEHPLVDPVDAEARRVNRRIELRLTPREIELDLEPPSPEDTVPDEPTDPSPDFRPPDGTELDEQPEP